MMKRYYRFEIIHSSLPEKLSLSMASRSLAWYRQQRRWQRVPPVSKHHTKTHYVIGMWYHQNKMLRVESKNKRVYVVLRSKKQEMVGLLTPKVVVTDLSSFLSSILLCRRRKQKDTKRKKEFKKQDQDHKCPTAGPSK